MSRCRICPSYAINPSHHGRDEADLDLCDVCYWRARAPQWQPIATAPHGKWIYVTSAGASCGGVAMLADYWINPDMRQDQYAERATHWMPLPAAPEVK